MKKILCIILALMMLLSFAACKKSGGNEQEPEASQEETQQETGEEEKPSSNARANFILPYSESDSLNPYKAKTQINRAITTLLYDSLYKLDKEFVPQPVIAEEAQITSSDVTVKLKHSITFTDSSSLNASDVVYSFEKAKESKRYGELLGSISSAVAVDKYKVKFSLTSPDAFVLNVLTFPIIEYGSIEQKVPLGSGRYVFSTNKLTCNKKHISGQEPGIKTIGLYLLTKKINYVDALQIGNISFIFRDLSDCDIQRAVARSVSVDINNLIYIGINSDNKLLNDETLRQVLNMAVDKEDIASKDFHGYAVRTESPFNPAWKESSKKESVFNQAQAVEILEKNGYTYSSQTNKYRKSKDGKELSFKILVCKDNEFKLDAANSIAKNLSQVGINAQISSMSLSNYKEAVKEGKFDLYIGEVKLCENMSLSPFFTKEGKTRYGIDINSDIVKLYEAVTRKEKSVAEFENEFSKLLPFIPICYRQGMVMTANTLSENIESVSTDMFSNISEWKMN